MKNTLSILQSGLIKDITKQKISNKTVKGVSTSRDLSFSMKWNDVIFELSGSSLKHNHKIVPVDFKAHNPHFNIPPRSNSEEFIIGSIENLSKYVLSITFKSTPSYNAFYNDILDVLHDEYEDIEIKYI